MSKKLKLFLISNSKNHGDTQWLGWVKKDIREFLKNSGIRKGARILFVDFAGRHAFGDFTAVEAYNLYLKKAQEAFPEYEFISAGLEFIKINKQEGDIETVEEWSNILHTVKAIFVGGGNTWTLAENAWQFDLLDPLRKTVAKGMPYVGWSAGANLACPTICTTNDMCPSPSAASCTEGLNLIPFQINPHYIDGNPDKVGGETRADRINEYRRANPDTTVVGMYEGSLLEVRGEELVYTGVKGKTLKIWTKERIYDLGKETTGGAEGSAGFLLKN